MKRFFTGMVLCVASCAISFGQNATTVPVGYVSIPLTEKTLNLMSLPLQLEAVYASKVTAVGNATITDATATFGTVANSHYVRIKSGNAAGRELVVTANTATQLTLATGAGKFALPVDSSSANTANVAVGDMYELVPMFTLAEVFGAGTAQDPVALKSAATPATADQVTIYVDGTKSTYYHNGTNWRNVLLSDSANYNTKGIPPQAGISISRKPGGKITMLDFTGTVSSTPSRFQLPGGTNVAVPVSSPVGTTLANLNFSAMTGWTRNNNPKLADQVTVYRPNRTIGAYFLNSLGVWRNAGNPADIKNYGSAPIPAGSGLWIVRRGTATGSAANVASTLPYSL